MEEYHNGFPNTRLRRLRGHPKLRDLIRETRLTPYDFVMPLFIHHGRGVQAPIPAMPGLYQYSVDQLDEEIERIVELGIPGVILFGIPAHKDPLGRDSYSDQGVIQTAISRIKDLAPELLVISDACFCEYTDHGHCGVISERTGMPDVDNDATLELLAQQAISHANAGADIIAPSGMMDGMVGAIRQALDSEGFDMIPILSYSAKYCSALYGPFRQASGDSAPRFGDRKTYQMDPGNAREALREVALDLNEGADLIMVKPASFYLDVIHRVKQTHPEVPLAAYQVSGEFSMIKAAVQQGWLDERRVVLESLTAIKRAGADFIITYFAKEASAWLLEEL